MAVTTTTRDHGSGEGKSIIYTLTAAGDVTPAIERWQWSDVSVQVDGTFGTATVTIEGTNHDPNAINTADFPDYPAVWATLNDAQGNPLSAINAAKIEQMLEGPRAIRVSVGGTGACTLKVIFFMRRNQPLRV